MVLHGGGRERSHGPLAMSFLWRRFSLVAWLVLALGSSAIGGTTLRIVYYNIECWGRSSDAAITGSGHSLPLIIQAIGLHHIGTNAQPVDVLALEELQPTTLSNFVTQLNVIYGAGTYAYDPTADPNTGGGTDGIIYNTHTVQVISARAMQTGQNVLLQSNGTYVAAHTTTPPPDGTKGVTRAPMVYQLRPVGSAAAHDFYMYVSHARSTSDDPAGDARYAEAQAIRSDAKYKLPAGAHIIYGGDWNLFNGSEENAYKCLTGQVTSDAINWADNSAVWANANPTQAYDPMSKTSPPTTFTWSNSAADNGTYMYSDSTTGTFTMSSRIDIQLVNGPMLAAYNNQGGVQLAPDTGDPFDTSNFPSSKYPYAFETFGNNGTTPRGGQPTNAANHSLDDLLNTTPNAATVYTNLTESGTTGSDHYPLVGDYNIVPPPAPAMALTAQGFQANGKFQLKLSSVPSTAFGFQASTDLSTWTNIGSGTTDGSGALIFQAPITPAPDHRFYRAYWPFP